MKIKEILSQHRRDFTAMMVCEHCDAEEKLTTGYDDRYYHTSVIPAMKCKSCGEIAPNDTRPLAPKYPEGMTL